jgi:hypothetical protein
MDPSKRKYEDLKEFEMKMDQNKGTINELIENTIPINSTSKQDLDAKTFFKENVQNSDRLKFETPAFGKRSSGMFDFNMNMDDLKSDDLFKNKPKESDSVRLIIE